MSKALKAIVLTAIVMCALGCEDGQLTTATPTPVVPNAPDIQVGEEVHVTLAAIDYPVKMGYINKVNSWSGDAIAGDLGVPGFGTAHDYNYMALAFWKCEGEPLDIAYLWQNALSYFSAKSVLGTTTQAIQKAIRKRYNDAGKKLLVSTFGATEHPTTENINPHECGEKLGHWIIDNNLDGADIDWEDNGAMEAGRGEQWLIDFTIALRKVIPNHIVVHAPQAPYFKEEFYKNGAYITIDKAVGHLIDFYFVQFYNQGNTQYNTYQELFTHATGVFAGTSVKEIAARGVPMKKLVVGKPLLRADAANTGYICQQDLGVWSAKAYDELGFFAGVGHWQYPSDKTGMAIKWASHFLKKKCQIHKNCH